VSVIDTHTHRAVRVLPAGRSPVGVAITPDSKSAYVANEAVGSVSVLATRTGAVDATVPVGEGAFGVAVAPDGRSAYAVALGPGNVSAIDTRSHRVRATLSVGPAGTDPFNIAVTPGAVYVTNQGAATLAVIEPKSFKTVTTIAVGTSPYGVAVSP
jgi:YVTN family beta-propeller protein